MTDTKKEYIAPITTAEQFHRMGITTTSQVVTHVEVLPWEMTAAQVQLATDIPTSAADRWVKENKVAFRTEVGVEILDLSDSRTIQAISRHCARMARRFPQRGALAVEVVLRAVEARTAHEASK